MVERLTPQFKKGDRVVWRSRLSQRRCKGTIHAHDSWGFANGEDSADGLQMRYQVVWDSHAHLKLSHHTSVPEQRIQPLPAVEQLAEILHAPPTYTA